MHTNDHTPVKDVFVNVLSETGAAAAGKVSRKIELANK